MQSAMRLVVTGQDGDGHAVFTSDTRLPETELSGPNVRACFLWGRDTLPALPELGQRPNEVAAMPPPGGCRFSTLSIAPGANGDYHAFIVRALGAFAESETPGFHSTPTLDFIYVISGEFTLEVDSTQQRTLVAGEAAVLHGNRHRWQNRAETTATLLAVSIGAAPAASS